MRFNHKGTTEQKAKAHGKVDTMTQDIMALSPDELDLWLKDNLKTFNDVRTIMKRIILIVQSTGDTR